MGIELSKEQYDERYKLYEEELGITNLFFMDDKHPLRCTGFIPEGQDELSPDMKRAIKTMQASVYDRIKAARDNLACTNEDIAEFWGLKSSSASEVSNAVTKPEQLTKSKCLRICATLGVSPQFLRGNDHVGPYSAKEGTEGVLTPEELHEVYGRLNADNKRAVTRIIKGLLQAQLATERTISYNFAMFMGVGDAESPEEKDDYWREMDKASWLSGIAPEDSVIIV